MVAEYNFMSSIDFPMFLQLKEKEKKNRKKREIHLTMDRDQPYPMTMVWIFGNRIFKIYFYKFLETYNVRIPVLPYWIRSKN